MNEINSRTESRRIWVEILIGLVIIFVPFLIFIHLFFSQSLDELNFLGWEYSHGFANNNMFIWLLFSSIVPIILYTLFFLSTYQKWRFFLLPVIIINLGLLLSNFYPKTDVLIVVLSFNSIMIGLIFSALLVVLDNRVVSNFRSSILTVDMKIIINELCTGSNRAFISKTREVLGSKNHLNLRHYTCKIYHLLEVSKEPEYMKSEQVQLNKSFRLSDLMVGILIILFSSLYFAYDMLPKTQNAEVLGVQISSFGFRNIHDLGWYAGQKITMIAFLTLWFNSSRYWWRWALISPLALYTYQFWDIFSSSTVVEEKGNFIILPMTLFTIFLIVFIGKLLRNQYKALNYRDKLLIQMESNLKKLCRNSEERIQRL